MTNCCMLIMCVQATQQLPPVQAKEYQKFHLDSIQTRMFPLVSRQCLAQTRRKRKELASRAAKDRVQNQQHIQN